MAELRNTYLKQRETSRRPDLVRNFKVEAGLRNYIQNVDDTEIFTSH